MDDDFLFNNQLNSIEKYESMLKTNESYFFDESEILDIVHYYLDEGKEIKAYQVIKLGLMLHPTSFEIILLYAHQLFDQNNFDESDLLLDTLFNINSTDFRLFILKARIYSKKLKIKTAIQVLKDSLKFAPNESEVLYLIGMEYLYLEDFNKAITYFIKVLNDDTDDNKALNNLVFCYESLSQYQQAEVFLNNYINQNPYCKLAWFLLGKQCNHLKKYTEALTAFDYSLLIDEYFVGAYIEKGKSYEKLKKFEQAIACYAVTLNLEDPSASVYFKIGKCYERLNLIENAVFYYKKAVYEDPLFEKSWLSLIQLLIIKKDYQAALIEVENAIEMDGTNIQFKKNKVKIMQFINQKK